MEAKNEILIHEILAIQKQTSDSLTKVMMLICKFTLCSFYDAFF